MDIIERSITHNYKVEESKDYKKLTSPNANYIFDKRDGVTFSWGKTVKENPECFPGPVIADIEICVGCLGLTGDSSTEDAKKYGTRLICPFCYKSNTPNNVKYMDFNTFKKLFDTLPKTLTQIAFGADATLQLNPDIWKIMEYSRENGVIPNVTLANVINDEIADNLAKYCGAVAISRYHIPDICYNSVKKLTDRGMKQVNIHYMISKETLKGAYETIDSASTDERLKGLNAIVFLSLKTKGRGEHGFTPLTQEEFTDLVNYAREKNEEPFVIILDKIEDPHNLGAILRTANLVGAHGVIIPKRRAVGLTPTVAKTSAGAINYTPVAKVTNITNTIKDLKEKGMWFVCADMGGTTMYDLNLTGPIGLVIGNEGDGVSKLVKENCDMIASIPMKGDIDSLNASVAAGVMAYEIVRQRIVKG